MNSEMNDSLPKPRADSVLKTLPEERQHEIAEYARENTLTQTAQWLGESGLQTSPPALCRFLDWYRTKQTLLRNETVITTLAAELAKENPGITTERLHQIGHIFFTSLALQKQDHKAWYMAEQIALRTARMKLDTRKYDDEAQAKRETRAAAGHIDPALAGLSAEKRQEIETNNNIL